MLSLSRFIRPASSEPGLFDTKRSQLHPSRSRGLTSYLFRGVLTFSLIVVAHGALNASTGINGTADYLHWLLKNEDKGENRPGDNKPPQPYVAPLQLTSIAPQPNSADAMRATPRVRVVIERIRRNDTYADLMERQRIPKKTVKAFAQKAKPLFDLNQQLKTDTPVKLTFNQQNQLIGLGYPITREKTLRITVDHQQKISALLENSRPVALPEKLLTEEKNPLLEDQTEEDLLAEDDTLIEEELALDDDGEEPAPAAQAKEKSANQPVTQVVTIRPGDTLASLLARRQIPNMTS
ncbi:MAG: hypothetical protein HQM02_02815, partial [Magnetococcales bacterium]|nr:hypothetical protein [Magnetococcales bacterium]